MRTHIYMVSHRILPRETLQEPLQTFEALRGSEARTFCAARWERAVDLLPQGHKMSFSGVKIEPLDAPGVEAVVVRFPHPRYPTEPYFALLARRPGGTPGYFVLERSGSGTPFWSSYKRTSAGVSRMRGGDLDEATPHALLKAIDLELDKVMHPKEGGLQNLDAVLPLRAPLGGVKPGAPRGFFAFVLVLLLVLAALSFGGVLVYYFFFEPMPQGPHNQTVHHATLRVGQNQTLRFSPTAEGLARYEVWLPREIQGGSSHKMSMLVACSQGDQGEAKPKPLFYGHDVLARPVGLKSGGSMMTYEDAQSGQNMLGVVAGWWEHGSGEVQCDVQIDVRDPTTLQSTSVPLQISANQRLRDRFGL